MEYTWTARTVRPVMAVYVAGIFVGCMALAHFVLHSPDAARALALTGLGSVAALVPGILNRWEYRLTETGVAKRLFSPKKPREFKEVFLWDDLSHLAPTRTGFQYFEKPKEPRRLRRAFKLDILGGASGEFHVERGDLEEVWALLREKGVPVLGAPGRGETGGNQLGGE